MITTETSPAPAEGPAPTAPPSPSHRGPHLSRLRVGSEFTTQKGVVVRVQGVVVLVSQSGAESPSVIVERVVHGKSAVTTLTVGIFANHIRGASHIPGTGPRVDWTQVPRRPHGDVRGPGVLRPLLVGRGRRP